RGGRGRRRRREALACRAARAGARAGRLRLAPRGDAEHAPAGPRSGGETRGCRGAQARHRAPPRGTRGAGGSASPARGLAAREGPGGRGGTRPRGGRAGGGRGRSAPRIQVTLCYKLLWLPSPCVITYFKRVPRLRNTVLLGVGRSAPRQRKARSGSTAAPRRRTSKCRCGPV